MEKPSTLRLLPPSSQFWNHMEVSPNKKQKTSDDASPVMRKISVSFPGAPLGLRSGYTLKTRASSVKEVVGAICDMFDFPKEMIDSVETCCKSIRTHGKVNITDITQEKPKIAINFSECAHLMNVTSSKSYYFPDIWYFVFVVSKQIENLEGKIQKVAAKYVKSEPTRLNEWNPMIYKSDNRNDDPKAIQERRSSGQITRVKLQDLRLEYVREGDRSLSLPSEMFFAGYIYDTPILEKFQCTSVVAKAWLLAREEHNFLWDLVQPKAMRRSKIAMLVDLHSNFVAFFKPHPLSPDFRLRIYICRSTDVKNRTLQQLNETARAAYQQALHVVLDIDETILFYKEINSLKDAAGLDPLLNPVFDPNEPGKEKKFKLAVLQIAPGIGAFLDAIIDTKCKLYICTHGNNKYAAFVGEHLSKLAGFSPGTSIFEKVLSYQWYDSFYTGRWPSWREQYATKGTIPEGYHGKQVAAVVPGTSGLDWEEPIVDLSRVLIFDDKPWVWGPESPTAVVVTSMDRRDKTGKLTRLGLLGKVLKDAVEEFTLKKHPSFSTAYLGLATSDWQNSPPRPHDPDETNFQMLLRSAQGQQQRDTRPKK